jgi:signal transduction histidine kinase
MLNIDDNTYTRPAGVETHFAPAARASNETLRREIKNISNNPVIDTLLNAVGGLLAVLNEQRQILTINNTLLEALGIDDANEVLGLRPGEAIHCIHAHEHPGGCGTSQHCATCGAAIAIVVSLTNDTPEQRECIVTVERNGARADLCFQIQCSPITFEGQRFLMLFLQDTTVQQQHAALERTFFHDINNLIAALVLNSQLLDLQRDGQRTTVLAQRIKQLASRLGKEVEIQRLLSHKDAFTYQVALEKISVAETLQETLETFTHHPVSRDKTLELSEPPTNLHLITDASLLQRVLTNMLINAFEATDSGGKVKLWLEQTDHTVTFLVWNAQVIPNQVALRVFQRNFSTKAESGRGLGTYAIKLFGETYLGGKVDFTTSQKDGTVFRLCLPKER